MSYECVWELAQKVIAYSFQQRNIAAFKSTCEGGKQMCKPQETSLSSPTFIPTRHGDPGQSTVQLPLFSSSIIPSIALTLASLCSFLSPHYAILDSLNPFLQLIVSSTFYVFIFGASPPTEFILALCPDWWVMQLVRSLFSASEGQFPPSSLLFFLPHLFLMSLEPCSVQGWGNECNLGAIWRPLLSSPFIIFFSLSP